MSVIVLPRRHKGTRQPPAFVVYLPHLSKTEVPTVVTGVDGETQAAVLAEIARFNASIAEMDACLDRITALLAPFEAEGVR